MPGYFTNANGSIRAFTAPEIAEMGIRTRGVRDGSNPTWVRENGNTSVTTTNFVKAAFFERFCAYMLGAANQYSDSGTLKISRLLPQTFPGKPRIACVRLNSAKGYRFDGTLDADNRPGYDYMECEFTWQLMPFDLLADGAFTYEYERYTQTLPSVGDVQYLNLPGGAMNYYRNGGGGIPHNKPIPYSIGFPEPKSVISRKWHRLPYSSWGPDSPLFLRVWGDQEALNRPFAGTINLTRLFGYAPGYLLYLGVEEELRFDELGDVLCWDLTHKWQATYLAPHTWKYFFSANPADAAANGYYFTAKSGESYRTTAALPDNFALHNAREHNLLFDVN